MTVSTTGSRVRSRAVGVVVAALAAILVWVIAVPLLGVDLAVVQGGARQTVGLGAVVLTPLVVGLLGWALLALLERRLRNGRRIWSIVAVVVALLSIVGPIAAAVSAAVAITLVLMHLVVAAVLITTLPR